MPTNLAGRTATILAVIWICFSLLFPSVPPSLLWLLKPTTEISFKPNLKPGIDMVGGTSLLYEIKPAEGAGFAGQRGLAEQVMTALKKRVDPDGLLNLVWRPQGDTRLEIQMPLTATSAQAEAARSAFIAAQEALEDTNIRSAEVLVAVEESSGAERDGRLAALAMGSQTRQRLFADLVSAWTAIRAAREASDADAQAVAELRYDDLKAQVELTNLRVEKLQDVAQMRAESRENRLAEVRARFADFPARTEAIDGFIRAHDAFTGFRGGVGSAAELKRMLRGSGVLEFYIVADDLPTEQYDEMVARLQRDGPLVRAGDETRWFQVDDPGRYGRTTETYNDRAYALCYITSDRSMTNRAGATEWALAGARQQLDQGELKVAFTFNPAGAKLFGELTGGNIGKPLAIVLDGRVISAPNINSQIFGSGEITGGGPGGFSQAEARYLISTLDAGSLPAQLTDEPISERTIGPQLGEDNLRAGMNACIFGLILVAVFMIGYYYLSGLIAVVALTLNVVIILGAMAALNATFTLPGVAGIVLTIGMAVDANVLIFERLREEQRRGLSLRMALRNAYDRAWSAIVDSNVTTAITSLVLYLFASEEVRGFGLTLLIGLAASMFTALYVTKTIFAILIEKFGLESLSSVPRSFPAWDRLLNPNIDWVGKARLFSVASIVFIAGGTFLLVQRGLQGKLMDIEFASGTAIQFDLVDPMPIAEVRRAIEEQARRDPAALPSPTVVSVGADDREYEVVTTNRDAGSMKQAVLAAFEGKLNLVAGSTFDHAGDSLDEAIRNGVIVPIDRDTRVVEALAPVELRSHAGGAAIVLRNLQPALAAGDIRQRIDRQRLQPQVGAAETVFRPYDVVTSVDRTTALIMVSDPAIPFAADRQKWAGELVEPMWRLVQDAINNPPDLQKVTNFDASVASEAKRDAAVALTLSILTIMVYIWFRFGNVRYGVATVIALAHDVLACLAAVGYAHYLAETVAGQALLIDAYRINLAMIAALLTIVGYSMNDTVVIFDRIRENRGKYGHLSARIINDSLNQTLSRTLLTAGTTMLTILVMYVLGGAGIRGFTYVFIIGIIAGTYSSLAIAAPVLLIGAKREATRPQRPSEPAVQQVGA